MKIGICDDIQQERELIKKHCQKLGYNDIILYSSGEELLESSELSSLNLLFLDIELQGINGIEIKNQLETIAPSTYIVFNTTHHEQMSDAFGHNVIFFLTKPYSKDSIELCLNKVAHLTKEFYPVVIDKKTSVLCRNILYLHTEDKYTILYTTENKSYSSRKPLKEWAEELKKYDFCSISRSAVINLKHYRFVKDKHVLLSSGISLSVSRRYLQQLENEYNSYLLRKTGCG